MKNTDKITKNQPDKKYSWFRFYREFAIEPKVQIMSEVMQRRFVMLLCFRVQDELAKWNATEIAFALRISENELSETKSLFIKQGFIDEDWSIINWDKRQYKSDSSTERVRKHRTKAKQAEAVQKARCNADVTLHGTLPTATETPPDTDTDTESETEVFFGVSDDTPVTGETDEEALACPCEDIRDLYHKILPELPKVTALTKKRKGFLNARWNEGPDRQDLDWWRVYFEMVRKQPLLMGWGQGTTWKANFEWLIRPNNLIKVLEGQYEPQDKGAPIPDIPRSKELQPYDWAD